MESSLQSAGETAASSGAVRNGDITIRAIVERYMAEYAGQDTSRAQRLTWWCVKLGCVTLANLTDDEIFFALQELATQRGRYWAGTDADGKAIYKAKRNSLTPATLNRYAAALGAVLSWSVKKRIAPRGWDNPCKRLERHAENNERVRFLSDEERERLLAASRKSRWDRLYLMIMLGLTTGARRGELARLKWGDIDFEQAVAYVRRTKNGDRKMLPLVPTVIVELRAHAGAPSALIFASRRRPDRAYNFVPVWQVALRTAHVREFRFHDLRHSCASYLAQSGATLLEIGEVLGHRQLSVTKRYSHLTVKNKADLINRVLGGIK
jgi:integrase